MALDHKKNDERPCLHCMMVEVVDQFYVEHPVSTEPDAIDADEVVDATAKMVAELTSSQDGAGRQRIIETLMRQIMDYDKEFREQGAGGAPSSLARH